MKAVLLDTGVLCGKGMSLMLNMHWRSEPLKVWSKPAGAFVSLRNACKSTGRLRPGPRKPVVDWD
jgi:hypothetical protein